MVNSGDTEQHNPQKGQSLDLIAQKEPEPMSFADAQELFERASNFDPTTFALEDLAGYQEALHVMIEHIALSASFEDISFTPAASSPLGDRSPVVHIDWATADDTRYTLNISPKEAAINTAGDSFPKLVHSTPEEITLVIRLEDGRNLSMTYDFTDPSTIRQGTYHYEVKILDQDYRKNPPQWSETYYSSVRGLVSRAPGDPVVNDPNWGEDFKADQKISLQRLGAGIKEASTAILARSKIAPKNLSTLAQNMPPLLPEANHSIA